MSHQLKLNSDLKMIHLEYSGEIVFDERVQARDEVFQACEESGFVRVLVDMRKSNIRMSEKDVVKFASGFQRAKEMDGYRLACVIGPHNQVENLVETIITLEGINVKYFLIYDTAISWLTAV